MLYCNHDRPFVPDRWSQRSSASGSRCARDRLGRGGLGIMIRHSRIAGPGITLSGVELRYGDRIILSGLSGRIEPGSLTALIGSNGSGKTTLLRAIAGLHPLASGRIDRDGVAAADIALLAQGSHLDRSFPITCRDVVALAATRMGPFRAIGKERMAATMAALDRVGVAEMASRPIQALSAGQFQRVLFARTIVQDARLILLDEPFTAVDAATTRLLLSVIQDWQTQGRTVIAVLHDIDLVRSCFPHTLLLAEQSALWDRLPDPGRQAA
jgi:zinc/manganese transport system ATP-binding protein